MWGALGIINISATMCLVGEEYSLGFLIIWSLTGIVKCYLPFLLYILLAYFVSKIMENRLSHKSSSNQLMLDMIIFHIESPDILIIMFPGYFKNQRIICQNKEG